MFVLSYDIKIIFISFLNKNCQKLEYLYNNIVVERVNVLHKNLNSSIMT